MKRWFLVEKLVDDDGLWEEHMQATTADEALNELRRIWDDYSQDEKKAREGFYAYHAKTDGSGMMIDDEVDAVISLRPNLPICLEEEES